MGVRPTRWLRCALLALALVGGACSRGYQIENQQIVDRLQTPADAVLTDVDHYSYCSQDTCLLGHDRSAVLLTYRTEGADFSEAQRTVVNEYRNQLDEWESLVEEGCANASANPCDEIVQATFRLGEAVVSVNLDNWPSGFEVHVDAHGERGR